jgi:Membrane-associated sensor, integral membrane domain
LRLFSQVSFIRSRALFVLATGYPFTALIIIPHTLTYPGAFTPTGLLGAGVQSTAWLYIFWHLGFPLALLVYAWLKDEKYTMQVSMLSAIGSSAAIVLGLMCGLTLMATAGEKYLKIRPHIRYVLFHKAPRYRIGTGHLPDDY